ncbi:MAG TPA: glycine cleavage T C-terminal barrel domain-containing protein [Verrucomicrobiae bacterium]|nr:glycine cleavage T C-terminal barrel domain-containing protein [Verrucomicrobiae bacterium]
MTSLPLHEFHQGLNASFTSLNGVEVVAHYGDVLAEHAALCESAGVLDLSFRSRLCLTGIDRVRFLHGQITNDVNRLQVGEGCYAALTTAKGKMQSDLNVFVLRDELLLDFEPGYSATVSQRLEKYIVADDVQVVDVAPLYGLLSVQGPKSDAVVRAIGLFDDVPARPFESSKVSDPTLGELYLMNHSRVGLGGFELFVPSEGLAAVADKLIAAARSVGGRAVGWSAFEVARIEAGIPRFGVDMGETNLPQESGLEARALSYNKGCYIGQEVINRIHSIGRVNRELRGLRLADNLQSLPAKGDKLFQGDKEVGYITSAVRSPRLNANLALGYVHRDAGMVGTELQWHSTTGEETMSIVDLPFVGQK